jgi:hypothetical protein
MSVILPRDQLGEHPRRSFLRLLTTQIELRMLLLVVLVAVGLALASPYF